MPSTFPEALLVRAGTSIDKNLRTPLQEVILGRTLMQVDKSQAQPGVSRIETRKIGLMGPGSVGYTIPKPDLADMVQATAQFVRAVYHAKVFKIPIADIIAYDREGISIDTTTARVAAENVARLEDQTIIRGWSSDGGSTYEVKGFLEAAETINTKAYPLNSYGNPGDLIADNISMLDDENVTADAYNWIMHPWDYRKFSNNRNPLTLTKELPEIYEALNCNSGKQIGRIIKTKICPQGQSAFMPVDPGMKYYKLYVLEDIKTVLGQSSEQPGIQEIIGTSYEKIFPDFAYPQAIAKNTKMGLAS